MATTILIAAQCWFPHCLCLPEVTINSTQLGTGPLSEGSQHPNSVRHMVGVTKPWNGALIGGAALCNPASSPEMSFLGARVGP